MREILFKAKDKEGNWIEGYYATIPAFKNKSERIISGNFFIHCIINSKGTYSEVDPKTLCQYTGLKDVEGNKIFEGDIIHRHLNVHYCVAFYKSKWAAYPKNIDSGIYLDSIQFEDCETIGNIHD